jgi:MOSC domain-containing protein YiiM
MVTGRPDLIRRMVENGRTGWYLRVVRPDEVPVAGPITVVDRISEAPTVLEMHRSWQ